MFKMIIMYLSEIKDQKKYSSVFFWATIPIYKMYLIVNNLRETLKKS